MGQEGRFLLKSIFGVLLLASCLRAQFLPRTTTIRPDAIPENIYRWIEENAYICTNVPGIGGTTINFLTEEEGLRCALCPDVQPREIPRMACGIETVPNGQDVNIGCHNVPELCLLEYKERYADWFFPETGEVPKEEMPNEIFEATINPFLDNENGFDFDRMFGLPPDTTTTTTTTTTEAPQTTTTTEIPTTTSSTTRRPMTRFSTRTTTTRTRTQPFMRMGHVVPSSGMTKRPMRVMPTPIEHEDMRSIEKTMERPEIEENRLLEFQNPFTLVSSFHELNPETSRKPFPTLRPSNTIEELEEEETPEFPFETPAHLGSNELETDFRTSVPTHFHPFQHHHNRPEPQPHPFEPIEHRPPPQSHPFEHNRHEPPPLVAGTFHPQLEHLEKFNAPSSSFSKDLKSQMMFKMNKRPVMECRDTHRLCCYWAMAGECDANPFWMRVKCAKTCGTCNCSLREADHCVSTGVNCTLPTTTTTTTTITTTTTPTTTTTTTTTPAPTIRPRLTPPPSTRPRHAVTNRWYPWQTQQTRKVVYPGPPSRKPTKNELEDLYYTTTPETTIPTTTTTTTTTTPTTTTPQETCFNYHQLCSFWADLGECVTNPFWMRPHCQKACKSCGERLEDIYSPEPRPGCLNTHVLCPFWSFIGECGTNPRWMLLHCRLSCQVC